MYVYIYMYKCIYKYRYVIYTCVCKCICIYYIIFSSLNVGKYFLKLIDKHFKQDNILHKIFNRKI